MLVKGNDTVSSQEPFSISRIKRKGYIISNSPDPEYVGDAGCGEISLVFRVYGTLQIYPPLFDPDCDFITVNQAVRMEVMVGVRSGCIGIQVNTFRFARIFICCHNS
jgi:hypothetical protein